MKTVQIHHNSLVRIKLNEIGKAYLRALAVQKAFDLSSEVRQLFSLEPDIDENGWYYTNVWNLMRTFGHLLGPGLVPPWDGNIVVQDAKND